MPVRVVRGPLTSLVRSLPLPAGHDVGVPRWLLYVLLVVVVLVVLAILRAVLRARRRHVRRQVIDDQLDVPERTPITERFRSDQSPPPEQLVVCGSCGHQHPYTSGLRSGDSLLVDCPGCGRRTAHERAG